MTFIYWLVKRYKQRRSRLAATSQQVELKALAATSEFHAALQRAVEQLPTRTHAAIAEEDVSTVPSTDVECVVCMEAFEGEDERARYMLWNCKHARTCGACLLYTSDAADD